MLVHELGHFFLHHLPCTYQTKWENPRCGLPVETREFEAESVAWIVCRHMGVETKAREYLAGYMKDNKTIPPVDVLQIGRAVERIEALYKQPCEFKKSVFYKNNLYLQQDIEKVEKGQPSLF